MIFALYAIGAIAFIISLVAGFSSGSPIGFFISLAGGASSAVILFALARILENQENILHKLQYQEEIQRRSRRQDNKVCPKCDYKYESDSTSCPHCGFRD